MYVVKIKLGRYIILTQDQLNTCSFCYYFFLLLNDIDSLTTVDILVLSVRFFS